MKKQLLISLGIVGVMSLSIAACRKAPEYVELMEIETTETIEELTEETETIDETEEAMEEASETEKETEAPVPPCPYKADANGNEEFSMGMTVGLSDVRRQPEGTAAIYGTLEVGEEFQVLGSVDENWVKIVYQGHIGYILKGTLAASDQIAEAVEVVQPEVPQPAPQPENPDAGGQEEAGPQPDDGQPEADGGEENPEGGNQENNDSADSSESVTTEEPATDSSENPEESTETSTPEVTEAPATEPTETEPTEPPAPETEPPTPPVEEPAEGGEG